MHWRKDNQAFGPKARTAWAAHGLTLPELRSHVSAAAICRFEVGRGEWWAMAIDPSLWWDREALSRKAAVWASLRTLSPYIWRSPKSMRGRRLHCSGWPGQWKRQALPCALPGGRTSCIQQYTSNSCRRRYSFCSLRESSPLLSPGSTCTAPSATITVPAESRSCLAVVALP